METGGGGQPEAHSSSRAPLELAPSISLRKTGFPGHPSSQIWDCHGHLGDLGRASYFQPLSGAHKAGRKGSWLLLSPNFRLLGLELAMAAARHPVPEDLGGGAVAQANPPTPSSTPLSTWQFVYLIV